LRGHLDGFVGVAEVDLRSVQATTGDLSNEGETDGSKIRAFGLTATLSVWLAHCQKITERNEGFGMSIPAWNEHCRSYLCSNKLTQILPSAFVAHKMAMAAHIKFVGTNALIRNGRGTGSPVSGCIDELTTVVSSQLAAQLGFHTSVAPAMVREVLATHAAWPSNTGPSRPNSPNTPSRPTP
jgi:hypothetical protein